MGREYVLNLDSPTHGILSIIANREDCSQEEIIYQAIDDYILAYEKKFKKEIMAMRVAIMKEKGK